VAQLAAENELLKNVIRQRMSDEIKAQILSECKAIDLPPVLANNASAATSMLEKADYSLMAAIQAAQRSFIISDPSLPDNPIIFASKGFLDLCGYRLEEVLGRNCRFLQGPNTDPKQVAIMRQGIADGVDTSVCLLNYRADGSQFYNQIFVAALYDGEGKVINHVGVQVEVWPSVFTALHSSRPIQRR
jgi:PAS domain S-box-containing protein